MTALAELLRVFVRAVDHERDLMCEEFGVNAISTYWEIQCTKRALARLCVVQ